VRAHFFEFVATALQACGGDRILDRTDHVLAPYMLPREGGGFAETADEGVWPSAIGYHVEYPGGDGLDGAAPVCRVKNMVGEDVAPLSIFLIVDCQGHNVDGEVVFGKVCRCDFQPFGKEFNVL